MSVVLWARMYKPTSSLVFEHRKISFRFRINLARFLPSLFKGISLIPDMEKEELPVGFHRIYPTADDNDTFPQNGVRYIAINDNYDTADSNSINNDFAGIKNWFNEFYARDTSRKIRAVFIIVAVCIKRPEIKLW